jgi:glutathione synthase/RimK-type ligase-like ATP-grasp enzyme
MENLTIRGGTICIGQHEIDKVTSIWYRRALPLILPKNIQHRWVEWCEQEFNNAFLAALYHCDAIWINDPFRTKHASLKPLQLRVASTQAGFRVPEYIVTSSPDEARSFAEAFGLDETVIKPLGRPVVGHHRIGASTIFTNTCAAIEREDWKRISFCPSILQKRVHRTGEVRVTVVGTDVFAAEIDVSNISGTVDYRTIDPYTLTHRVITLPDDVVQGCLVMMEFFGLNFAAFDFLRDNEDMLYFTEINPSGQYQWIEETTGLKISCSMASLLRNGNNVMRPGGSSQSRHCLTDGHVQCGDKKGTPS